MPTAEGNAGDYAGDDAAEQTWRERRNQYPLPPEFRVATALLELPTVRVEVTGRNWFIHYRERPDCTLRGNWMIRTEPSNLADSKAVAVFVGQRQVGYLRSGKASFYSRALNSLGGSLLVPGEQDGYTYWVHLPRKGALREYVRSLAPGFKQ